MKNILLKSAVDFTGIAAFFGSDMVQDFLSGLIYAIGIVIANFILMKVIPFISKKAKDILSNVEDDDLREFLEEALEEAENKAEDFINEEVEKLEDKYNK